MSEKDFERGYKSGFNFGKEQTTLKAVEIVHETILSFIENDDSEYMTDKDLLLLSVNKSICQKLKEIKF